MTESILREVSQLTFEIKKKSNISQQQDLNKAWLESTVKRKLDELSIKLETEADYHEKLENKVISMERKFQQMELTIAKLSQQQQQTQHMVDDNTLPKITRLFGGRTAHPQVNQGHGDIPPERFGGQAGYRGQSTTATGFDLNKRFCIDNFARFAAKQDPVIREDTFRENLKQLRQHLISESTPTQVFDLTREKNRSSSVASDSTFDGKETRNCGHRDKSPGPRTTTFKQDNDRLLDLVEKLAVQPTRGGASPGTIASVVAAAVNGSNKNFKLRATYDGKTSFMSWVAVAEFKLHTAGVNEEEWFNKITDRFEGEALVIVNRLIKELKPGDEKRWIYMKERLTKLFARNVDTLDAFTKMMAVKQTSRKSAISYYLEKSKAMEKWNESDETKMIYYMIEGALPEIQRAAEMLLKQERNPSLADMENILDRAEAWMKDSASYAKLNQTSSSSYKSFSSSNNRSDSRDRSLNYRRSGSFDRGQIRSGSYDRNREARHRDRSSPRKRDDREDYERQRSDRSRERNLSCFKCGEQGHYASRCPKHEPTPAKPKASFKSKTVAYSADNVPQESTTVDDSGKVMD